MVEKIKKKPVFIASSPNTEADDLLVALKLLFSPWRWGGSGKKSAFSRTRAVLASFHNADTSFLYNTGRAALHELLLAMNIGKGDEVILQAFTCVAVPTAIVWRKAVPVYVDINDNSFNAPAAAYDLAITPKTRAVIVQHTFGEISPVDELRSIVDKHNAKRTQDKKIYLIEDCAHSIGTIYHGKRVGEWGDAAFFSFGQEKVISCTQGGAAITHDKEVEKKLTDRYKKIRGQFIFTTIRMILHPILWSVINPFYYVPSFTGSLTIGRALIVFFRLLGILQPHVNMNGQSIRRNAHVRKLSNAQAMMLGNQFAKLHYFMLHRIELVEIYKTYLMRAFTVPNSSYPLLRFPIRVSNPSLITSAFKKNKIILGNWYSAPIHLGTSQYKRLMYKEFSCRHAETISKTIINLPTHIQVSVEDAERIANIALETQTLQ